MSPHARLNIGIALATLLLLTAGCATARRTALPGFTESPYFAEQVKTYAFTPDVTVHINAPAVDAFDPRKPVHLVIFALPNGNTIPQTIGCAQQPDLDWHFFIQHIGAQTRALRAAAPDANLVVAYIEAAGRSWPSWRKNHADSGPRLVELVDTLRAEFPAASTTVALTAHSGGGSMIFGFINQVDQIPDWIDRIVFLDANYGYTAGDGHLDKLLAWLGRSPHHYLGVVAYDDRNIELNGKKVVGPTGGTYRRTEDMVADFGGRTPLTETATSDRHTWRGLDGRLDIALFTNPDNKILHTVLVEKNGFIHALTFGTPGADQRGVLFAPAAYAEWIQHGPTELPSPQ